MLVVPGAGQLINGQGAKALGTFGVESFRREGRIGIWTQDIDGREAKIGATSPAVVMPATVAEPTARRSNDERSVWL